MDEGRDAAGRAQCRRRRHTVDHSHHTDLELHLCLLGEDLRGTAQRASQCLRRYDRAAIGLAQDSTLDAHDGSPRATKECAQRQRQSGCPHRRAQDQQESSGRQGHDIIVRPLAGGGVPSIPDRALPPPAGVRRRQRRPPLLRVAIP